MAMQIETPTIQTLGHKVIPLEDRITRDRIEAIEKNELDSITKALGREDLGVRAVQYPDEKDRRYLVFTIVGKNLGEKEFLILTKNLPPGYVPVEVYKPVNEGGLRLL